MIFRGLDEYFAYVLKIGDNESPRDFHIHQFRKVHVNIWDWTLMYEIILTKSPYVSCYPTNQGHELIIFLNWSLLKINQ